MNWKRFLAGLPALILAPALVIAALAAYVYWVNAQPQTGPLQTTVRPQVVWPWQQVADLMTVQRDVRKAATPARPIDMVFLVDVSGSMTLSLPAMAEAAHRLALDLERGQPGRVRFALIRFDTRAEVNTDWTADPEQLKAGLDRLAPFTGQNDTREAFVRLREVLQRARPEASKVAVFYTDGGLDACPLEVCWGREMTEDEMIEAAGALRRQGVELYSIGLPGQPSNPLMVQMTGAASRVLESGSVSDLAHSFRSLGTSLTAGSASGAVLTHRLDGRHFDAPIAGTGWNLQPSGALQLDLGMLTGSPATYWHPLVPRSAGVWRVGLEPPRLTFIDPKTGQVMEVAADRRPALLVITWLSLLFAALPILLWLLANLLPRRVHLPEEAEPAAPLDRQPSPPARLPALPPPAGEERQVVPTLFVGLGASGLRALQAARADLKQSHLGAAGWPYRFLSVDLDPREPDAGDPFDPWDDYPIERITAPAGVVRAASYLPQPGAAPAHWSWFDGERYLDAAREDLSLAAGSRGDRALARLALFRWLEGGGLWEALVRAGEDLTAAPAVDGVRQVIVFASRDGGWGSGTFLDFGRLLQRIGRRRQAEGGAAIAPEMIGVLCDSPERQRPENREALALEIQSTVLTGGYPARTCYLPGHEFLDRIDTETPYHRILSVSGREADDVAAQCGDLAAVLVERRPRLGLVEPVSRVATEGGAIVPVTARGVYVTPTAVQEQVHLDLLLRLLGPDVLLDLQPSPGGGFEAAAVPEETASNLLSEWTLSESAGTPLRLLLAATQDPSALPSLVQALDRIPSVAGSPIAMPFVAGVGSRLRGKRSDGSGWRRGWMPGTAAAVLRLLAQRIDALRPTLERAGGSPGARAAVAEIGDLATAGAAGLEGWIAGLGRICEELSLKKVRLAERGRHRPRSRALLDTPESPAQIEAWSRECLERWLGTPDTISPLRERLFLALSIGGGARVVLRSYIGQPCEHATPEPAMAELAAMTRSLASLALMSRIGGALARLAEDRRGEVARGLVQRESRPLHVLLAAPGTIDPGSLEGVAVRTFLDAVPQPADHGVRDDVASDDPSAVRRLEVAKGSAAGAASAHLVEEPELEAERVRQRLEEKYALTVPVLPPDLRIALSHPEGISAFAHAYKAGRIVRRSDASGRKQWFSIDGDRFLTFGNQSSLAAAAASSAWDPVPAPPDAGGAGAAGDFSELHQWARAAGTPSPDVLALAALELFTR